MNSFHGIKRKESTPDRGSQKNPETGRHPRKASDQAALVGRSLLDHEDHGGGEFPASRNPLQDTQGQEGDRRHDSDRFIDRQTSRDRGGTGHGRRREDQRLAATGMIREITEKSTPGQSCHITGGENPEHRQGGGELVLAGKEKKSECRGQHAVEGKIIPLHQVTGHRGQRRNR